MPTNPLDALRAAVNPTSAFKPLPIGTPIPVNPQVDTPPSAAKTGFEGTIDAIQGLMGVGPETRANQWGQLAGAAIPLGSLGKIDGVETGMKGLYSRVSRAAQALPETFHPNKALSVIGNAASQEEMDYRGLSAFLKGQGDQPTTRAQVLQHLSENPPPQVNVKTLGEPAFEDPRYTAGGPPETPTKYSQHTLPGGSNYRENLITLPDPSPKLADFPSRETYDAHIESGANTEPLFHSSHWDDPNVLVHSMVNERTLPTTVTPTPFTIREGNFSKPFQVHIGDEPTPYRFFDNRSDAQDWIDSEGGQFNVGQAPKGRFIEEVQSDWHQQGREKGYRLSPEEYQQLNQELRDRTFAHAASRDTGVDPDPQSVQRAQAIEQRLDQHDHAVPDGPFKSSTGPYTQSQWTAMGKAGSPPQFRGSTQDWADLALKQQLLDVAGRPDLEWLGHNVGQTISDRYDLSQTVNQLLYHPESGELLAYAHDREQPLISEMGITPQRLQDYIGKDATTRLMQAPRNSDGYNQLVGSDLQVGGEGMKQFYDQTLPNKLKRILGQVGGNVEPGEIAVQPPYKDKLTEDQRWEKVYPPSQQVPAWIAKLTPEQKAEILKKGFPLMMLLGMTPTLGDHPPPDHSQPQP